MSLQMSMSCTEMELKGLRDLGEKSGEPSVSIFGVGIRESRPATSCDSVSAEVRLEHETVA